MTPPRPTYPTNASPQTMPAHPQSGWGSDPRMVQQPPYPPNAYQSPPPQTSAPSQPSTHHPASLPAPATSQAPLPPPQTQPAKRAVQDLLSSPEESNVALPGSTDPGAPPPIPPSKPPPPSLLHLHSILLPHLNASLPPLVQSLQSNRAHLLERQEDLNSGEPAIRDEMARLEAVKKVCDSVGKKMDDVVARGEERVAELEQKGEVSVDEVVCGISIVHNQ